MYTIFFTTIIIFKLFENETFYFWLGAVHVGLTGYEQSQFEQLTPSLIDFKVLFLNRGPVWPPSRVRLKFLYYSGAA
jgi:hypothetical protein